MKFIRHAHGDRRVIKRFALFPITICYETRWLETVYIKQRYNTYSLNIFYDWENEEFYTKEDAKQWWARSNRNDSSRTSP